MKKYGIILAASIALILTGCSNYGEKYLEKHKEIVSNSIQQSEQKTLFGELNVEEQQLYQIILEEGKENVDNVSNQIAKAIAVISESQKMIDEEKARLLEQRNSFKETEKMLQKLKDSEEDKKIKKLHDTFIKRMDVYEQALTKYEELLNKKKALYGFLQNNTPLKTISSLVDEVNALSAQVEKYVADFNQATKLYNDTSHTI